MPHALAIPSDADFPALIGLIADAFAGTREGCETWLRSHPTANLRIFREAAPDACLIRIPMAQHFGGSAVPMIGIAGVAVSPVVRGRGLARAMMAEGVREIAREGVALSTLYASTRPLYRAVGYEAAGSRYEHRLCVARLASFKDALPVTALSEADHPAVRECHEAYAPRHNGTVRRGDYNWTRIWKNRDEVFRGFGVRESGTLTGYVTLNQRRKPENGHHDLALSDAAILTPAAARALSTFLAGYATMGDDLLFYAGREHPFAFLMPHPFGTCHLHEHWMLRICNLRAALESRGYHPAARGSLTLQLDDPIIPENHGSWTLDVAQGRATLRAGAHAPRALQLSARGLAAVYTGHLTPHEAALAGLASGDDAALAEADAIFALTAPWMTDFF